MEFRARYQLVGIFTLAVIIAAFAFIYWLSNDGFTTRKNYRVDFSEPVSGLSIGGAVLFNGLRVGEVTALRLDGDRPGHLLADISVASDTPIKSDTLVGVDFQGLTGAASILLSGGSPNVPAPAAKDGEPAILKADPAASRSWTRSAGRLLSSFDQWLGKNSSRLDGILAGFERMTGAGGNGDLPIYDLPAASGFDQNAKAMPTQLVVEEPSVSLALNTDKLQKAVGANKLRNMGNGHWADNLPNLVQARIIQSFENAGYINKVLRPSDAIDPPAKLLLDIRKFHIGGGASPVAVIDFTARLVDGNGKIIAARPFNGEKPASPAAAENIEDAAAAMGQVFARLEKELIGWTLEHMPKSPDAASEGDDSSPPPD
jgi:phospholipid/cholesterol/gamma-HCH transport system substrate-binding protein